MNQALLNGASINFTPDNKHEVMKKAQEVAKSAEGCIGISTYGWGIGQGKLQLVFK